MKPVMFLPVYEIIARKNGASAKNDGQPRHSPYTDRNLTKNWLIGWDEGE